MPVPKARCRFGCRSRSSRSGCSLAAGSMLAAASMAMILSPFFSRTPPSSTSVPHEARLGKLHGREEAQKFLDRQIGAAPVRFEPVAQFRIACVSSWTDPLIRCVVVSVPAPSSRKTIATISLAADAPALLLDPNKLRDQPFAAMLARVLQLPFEIAPHRHDRGNKAQEAECARQAREAVRPGHELRPVGRRQPEHLADDGQAAACAHIGRRDRRVSFAQTVRRPARRRWRGYAAPWPGWRGGERLRRRCCATGYGPARPWSACCWRARERCPASTSAGPRPRRRSCAG